MVYRRKPSYAAKPRSKRTYKRKAVRKPTARNSMVKLVKSIIHKQAENKEADWAGLNTINIFGGTNFNTQNIIPMSPYSTYLTISQGTTASSRIGNKIQTRKLILKFVMTPLPYNGATNTLPKPQDVMIYWVKSKDTPVSLTSSSGMGAFFQASAGASGPTGNIFDNIKQVNTDVWTVCHKMRLKLGNANYAGTGSSAGDQTFANNDYKLNHIKTVDLTKHCPKIVSFNDNNTTPISPTLQMIILPCNADGTGYNSSSQYQCQLYYQLYYQYEDM